jgi:hypothetical protein
MILRYEKATLFNASQAPLYLYVSPLSVRKGKIEGKKWRVTMTRYFFLPPPAAPERKHYIMNFHLCHLPWAFVCLYLGFYPSAPHGALLSRYAFSVRDNELSELRSAVHRRTR